MPYCKPCKQRVARKEDLTEEEQSQGEQDEDFLISSFKAKRQEINAELKNFNISKISFKIIKTKWQITLFEKLKVNVPQNYVMKPMG